METIKHYQDLEWESPVHKMRHRLIDGIESIKPYNEGLALIKQQNPNCRYARPNELFGLKLDGIEGKLKGTGFEDVYTDLIWEYAVQEWLSLAFFRVDDDRLIAYLDPENLAYYRDTESIPNTEKEVKDIMYKGAICGYKIAGELKYSSCHEFNISGIPSNKRISLNKFGDDFVKFIAGRPIKELPIIMTETMRDVYEPRQFSPDIILPPKNVIRPMTFTRASVSFNFNNAIPRKVMPIAL